MNHRPESRQELRDGTRLREITSGKRNDPGKRAETGDCKSAPSSTYEAVTRQMVRALRDEVRDVKQRINQLITLIIAAILIEALMRLIGISG